MSKALLATAGIAVVFMFAVQPASAQEDTGGPLKIVQVESGITWTDHENEAEYRVEGSVTYLLPPSCPGRPGGEVVEFSETLPRDSTAYQYPPGQDDRLTWAKDIIIRIDAVDQNGAVLANDGFAFTADHFCTPEEIAAAGTGVGEQPRSRIWLAAAILLGLGIALLAGGSAMRRRA